MSRALIKSLQEQRKTIHTNATAMLEAAEADKRQLSADEEGTWQKANADLDSLGQRIDQLVDFELRNAEAVEAIRKLDASPIDAQRGGEGGGGVIDEVRSFMRGERREVEIARDVKFRDLSKGTAGAGGATVPTTFYGQLMEHMIEVSAILSAGATVLETASGETIDVPITTAFSTAALVAENVAIAESDPVFSKRSLGAYKYGVLLQAPRELIDDTGVDLEGFLARQCGRAVGNALGLDLILGNGASKPAGIAPAATVGVTGGTGVVGAFTADNLIDLFYSVIAPYRNSSSAAWLMKDQTLAAARKLKDTTGQYLWQPSLQLGVPDMLLGKPVRTDPNVASVALGARSVIFGDISAYWVRLAGGVRFERSTDYAFNTDQITYKCVVRGDGILVDQTGAVKAFVGGAS